MEKFIGDAVMAVFGAPVGREDDAERAVRAGVAILQAVRDLGVRTGLDSLAVRIGIAIEAPDTSAFFSDARRLIIGRKNVVSTSYSSAEVAARSRLRRATRKRRSAWNGFMMRWSRRLRAFAFISSRDPRIPTRASDGFCVTVVTRGAPCPLGFERLFSFA